MQGMKELSRKVQEVLKLSSGPAFRDSIIAPDELEANSPNPGSQLILLDPNISQTKGRKRSGVESTIRIKSGVELNFDKKKQKCHLCNKLARHDSRNCPLNQNRRHKSTYSEGHNLNKNVLVALSVDLYNLVLHYKFTMLGCTVCLRD
ncbi:hypothetical protein Dimus_001128 [Dionaea muscipula]